MACYQEWRGGTHTTDRADTKENPAMDRIELHRVGVSLVLALFAYRRRYNDL